MPSSYLIARRSSLQGRRGNLFARRSSTAMIPNHIAVAYTVNSGFYAGTYSGTLAYLSGTFAGGDYRWATGDGTIDIRTDAPDALVILRGPGMSYGWNGDRDPGSGACPAVLGGWTKADPSDDITLTSFTVIDWMAGP